MLTAEATPLPAEATPLFAGASASMWLPRERIECPEVRGIRPFGCVAFGRFVRCRPATGATGVSTRGCRTPALDVGEGFDVVRRRRGVAQKAASRRNDSVGSKSGAAGVEAGSGEGRRKSYFRRSGASRVAQLSVRSAPIGRIARFQAVILSERVREARKTARKGRRLPCGTGPT